LVKTKEDPPRHKIRFITMSDKDSKIAPRVNHKNRKYTDVPCAILFLAAIGLFFGIG
jgi:hypothetical protein